MEWAYKTTSKQLDRAGTVMIANRGMLCRAAHADNGSWAVFAQTEVPGGEGGVAFGDRIHLYYTGDQKPPGELGCYEVIRKDDHPKASSFGEIVPETALYKVGDEAIIREIDTREIYQHDHTLGCFTVWLVRKIGPSRPYDPAVFPGRGVLVRLPAAS